MHAGWAVGAVARSLPSTDRFVVGPPTRPPSPFPRPSEGHVVHRALPLRRHRDAGPLDGDRDLGLRVAAQAVHRLVQRQVVGRLVVDLDDAVAGLEPGAGRRRVAVDEADDRQAVHVGLLVTAHADDDADAHELAFCARLLLLLAQFIVVDFFQQRRQQTGIIAAVVHVTADGAIGHFVRLD